MPCAARASEALARLGLLTTRVDDLADSAVGVNDLPSLVQALGSLLHAAGQLPVFR